MNKRMDHLGNIPFYLIESFLAAAQAESFQVAGERLQLTQSALSRQMQLLESSLPHKVFTMDGRKKVLTKYGQTLYDILEPQFSQTQGLIKQAALLFSEPKKAHIKICGRGELLDTIAQNLRFAGSVSFHSMDSLSAEKAVLARKCDIGIVHAVADSAELVLKPFFVSRLRIVVPKALLRNKPDSKRELAEKLQNMPCLNYKNEDPAAEKFLSEWGIEFKNLNVARTYSNYSSLLEMVHANLGWAIIPSNMEISESQNHCFQLSGRSADERQFYLCFRRELKDASWFKDLLVEFKTMPR
jgi:DNA-binding transcriptional LysR family regulator